MSRRIGESIYIGENIKIMIIDIDHFGQRVRIGFDAPRDIEILREELVDAKPDLTPVKP